MMHQIGEGLLVFAGHIDGELIDVAERFLGPVAVVELELREAAATGLLVAADGYQWRGRLCRWFPIGRCGAASARRRLLVLFAIFVRVGARARGAASRSGWRAHLMLVVCWRVWRDSDARVLELIGQRLDCLQLTSEIGANFALLAQATMASYANQIMTMAAQGLSIEVG